MTLKHNGGPAFPFGQISEVTGQPVNGFYDPGMTLRDWFAGLAMQGIVTHEDIWDQPESAIAKSAYDLADAMLAQREELVDQYNAAADSHAAKEQQP